MKPSTILVAVLATLCLSVEARHHKTHKRDQHRREHAPHHEQLEKELREEAPKAVETKPPNEEDSLRAKVAPDPCGQLRCKEGQHCRLNEAGEAHCVCMESCSKYNDPRSAMCSSQNVTYDSECEFNRQVCLCERHDHGCIDKRILDNEAHLDYYGQCQELQSCTASELKEFPSRMSQWLTNVMETLDQRQELEVRFSDMHRRSRRSKTPQVLPILWEFCEMDTSKDRIVSRSELFPLIAPLKSLEHCIGDFLDRCDVNSNGEITLEEWGHCLNLPDDSIEDICDGVGEHHERHVRIQG